MSVVRDYNSSCVNGKSTGLICRNNGEMYHLRPYYDTSLPIDLPTTMYKLNRINQNAADCNTYGLTTYPAVATALVNGECVTSSRRQAFTPSKLAQKCKDSQMSNGKPLCNEVTLEQLEMRQEAVLTRLDELRIEINRLLDRKRPFCGLSVDVSVQDCTAVLTFSNKASAAARLEQNLGIVSCSTLDLVLNADPENPPLSLFILYEMLRGQFSVRSTSYVHSSVTNTKLRPAVMNIFRNDRENSSDFSTYQLGFTVIWKQKGKNLPSLTVGTTQRTPIFGESNIARFLARLVGDSFYDDDDDILRATQIDDVIDLSVEAIATGDASLLARVLKPLESALWILGMMSLADVIVWSALKQSSYERLCGNRVPDYIHRWIRGCEQKPEFGIVKRLVK